MAASTQFTVSLSQHNPALAAPQPEDSASTGNKTLSVFAAMAASIKESAQEYRLAGQFSKGTAVRQFWSFDAAIPYCNRFDDIPMGDTGLTLVAREFRVAIPSEYEEGLLVFKIVKKNLSTQEETWCLNPNFEIPLKEQSTSPCLELEIQFEIPADPFAKLNDLLDDPRLGEVSKHISDIVLCDPQLEAIEQDHTLLFSVQTWGFPMLRRWIDLLQISAQNDPSFQSNLAMLIAGLKNDPETFSYLIETLPELVHHFPIDLESLPDDGASFIPHINTLRTRLVHLLSSDPQTSNAWTALAANPQLLDSIQHWAFPLLRRVVALAEQDPEIQKSITDLTQTLKDLIATEENASK